MSTKGDTRRVFMFSYHEHDWVGGVEGQEAAGQAILQMVTGQEWTPVDTFGPEAIEQNYDPDTKSVDDLMARVREILVDEWELPLKAVQIPFGKLKAIIARDGWVFVSGWFCEFEGNHNDSEIHVVLEKMEK